MDISSSKSALRILTSVALAALLAGCFTPMSAQECGSTDWEKLGYRDGNVYGLRPQIEIYASQCGPLPSGAQSAYMTGWTDGYAEFNRRISGSCP